MVFKILYFICCLVYLSLKISILFIVVLYSVMAGIAPEGSQYDANQFDAKMNDVYAIFYLRCPILTFLLHIWQYA